jgi:carboxymethylenebutenolidase
MINSLLHEVPRVPTILHYGAQDTSIPQTMIDEVHLAHARLPIHLYDAGHGFCRMGHPAHDAAACDLAVERTVAHFLAHA